MVTSFRGDVGKVVRILLRQYKKQWHVELRVYEEETGTGRMVPTGMGFILPVECLPDLTRALREIRGAVEEKVHWLKEKGAEEISLGVCGECGKPVRKVEEGIFECPCGLAAFVKLRMSEALLRRFDKMKDFMFFPEFSAGD